jgi:hypothetical protein
MTDDLFDLAASLTQSPARQCAEGQVPSPSVAMVAGGPVQTTRPPGEEPTPGSAVAISSAARASTGVVAGAGAASLSGGDRVGAGPGSGAVSGFTLPDTRVPLRFGEGEHRLVGAVHLGGGNPPPPPPQPFPPNPFPRPTT